MKMKTKMKMNMKMKRKIEMKMKTWMKSEDEDDDEDEDVDVDVDVDIDVDVDVDEDEDEDEDEDVEEVEDVDENEDEDEYEDEDEDVKEDFFFFARPTLSKTGNSGVATAQSGPTPSQNPMGSDATAWPLVPVFGTDARGFPEDPTPQTACSVTGTAPKVFVQRIVTRWPCVLHRSGLLKLSRFSQGNRVGLAPDWQA